MVAAEWKASCAGTWRTMSTETPVARYVQRPTPSASSKAAVSRSARALRAISPPTSPAAPERPVVAAAEDEEPVRDARRGQLLREQAVLEREVVVGTRVEPEIRVSGQQPLRDYR